MKFLSQFCIKQLYLEAKASKIVDFSNINNSYAEPKYPLKLFVYRQN